MEEEARTITRELNEVSSKLKLQLDDWITTRKATIRRIEEILKELAEHHRNVKIAGIAGGGASAAGVGMTIVGGILLLSPFAPVGAALLIGGGATAVAGSLTSLGAAITKLIIEKLNRDDSKKLVENDAEQLKEVCESLSSIDNLYNDLNNKFPDPATRKKLLELVPMSKSVSILLQGRAIFKAVRLLRMLSVGVHAGLSAGKAVGTTALKVGGKTVFGAIGLILSAVEIGQNVHGLIRKTKGVTEEQLEECLTLLKKELKEFQELYDQMVT